jgi:hypothetical protein
VRRELLEQKLEETARRRQMVDTALVQARVRTADKLAELRVHPHQATTTAAATTATTATQDAPMLTTTSHRPAPRLPLAQPNAQASSGGGGGGGAEPVPAGRTAPPARLWRACVSSDADDADGGGSVPLTVVQYNVLADHLCTPPDRVERYLWEQCPASALRWDARWRSLLQELHAMDADVCCMQEVQHEHYVRDIRPELASLGYAGIFAARNVDPSPTEAQAGRRT